jgi:hypothetical protein
MRQFNVLLQQPELNALNAHTKEAQLAQKIWETIAPDNLPQFSHASGIKNKELNLYAHNNAVAAKIKLLIPSLLIQLEKQGCEVTSIQVKVQVKSSPQAKSKAIKRLSSKAGNELNQLAEKLSGTALGDALSRLATKAN